VVSSPQLDPLGHALAGAGAQVTRTGPAQLRVKGMPAAAVGHAAFTAGVELHELRTEKADLEQLFFALTQGQYSAGPGGPPPPPGAPVPAAPTTAQGGVR
jgi:ABC-2 type transport system ATP-binding protein